MSLPYRPDKILALANHNVLLISTGAALSCRKGIFQNAHNSEGVALYSQKLQWANGSGSDLIAMLNAYLVWERLHNEKAFGTDNTREKREQMKIAECRWADRHFIELASLYECRQLKLEIEQRLQRLQILPRTGFNRVVWTSNERPIILKVVIAGN